MSLRALTLADTPALSTLLSAAFEKDPGARHLLPDDARWPQQAPWFYERLLRLMLLHGPCVVDRNRQSLSCWIAPADRISHSLRAQLAVGLYLVPFKLGVGALPRILAVSAELDQLHARWRGPRSWFLDLLAVHPGAQGRGLAQQLLQTQLALIDAAGDDAYLFTHNPNNVPYYQRFGFALCEEFASAKAPSTFVMRR